MWRTADLRDMLSVLHEARDDAVIITTMAAEREWLKLSDHPRDFFYMPSSMGQAPALGLGLALAQPAIDVVVVNGDGCMLMNLGVLVTIADTAPPNLRLIVVNNGVYEVTGRQPTAGADRVDYAALARAAGFPFARRYVDLTEWQSGVREFMQARGPAFAEWVVKPFPGEEVHVVHPGPMQQQIERLRRALGVAADHR